MHSARRAMPGAIVFGPSLHSAPDAGWIPVRVRNASEQDLESWL